MDTYYICEEQSLVNIANAIREKTGTTKRMTITEMEKTVEDFKEEDSSMGIIDGSTTEIYNATITQLPSYVFYCNSILTSVGFPNCTSIASSVFKECSSLTSVSFPMCTRIGSSAFYSCPSLIGADFPKCSIISGNAFNNCTSLISANFPICTSIGSRAFYSCSSLVSVNFPACKSIASSAFEYCTSLTEVKLPVCTSIGSRAFLGCSNLMSVILEHSSIVTLSSANIFSRTPLSVSNSSGVFGSIYVPFSLVKSYKTATNWSVYADRITVYGDGIFVSDIKNEILLFNESKKNTIDVTRFGEYLLEDISVNVYSSDASIVSVSDIVVVDDSISFITTAQQIEGSAIINVDVSCGDYSNLMQSEFTVYESVPEAVYEVQAVDGANYGFELNSNGYYESKNKGVNNSAAVCKLVFNTCGIYNLYLDCINSGESNYDYGLISQVDTELGLTYSDDGSTGSTKVFKNFKGLSNTSVQTIELGSFDANEHFVYIKFRKDVSQAGGNDSLQFKVRMEM